MSQQPQNSNNKACNRPIYNQHTSGQPALTDERVKEIIMDSLIELNLVPRPQKRKAVDA